MNSNYRAVFYGKVTKYDLNRDVNPNYRINLYLIFTVNPSKIYEKIIFMDQENYV